MQHYLNVPFAQKDAAKALGARWDGAARKWYVPAGLDLGLFAAWSADGVPAVVAPAPSALPALAGGSGLALPASDQGISLSRLLQCVASAVAQAFSAGVWTTVEVVQANLRNGHVFLEVSERDAEGRVLAKANAAIWATTAARILPEFEQATGATLAAGIKLLVRARPVFKPQFGFSLEIDAIDPAFTLGDLEARKREIRQRLQAEGLFDRNRQLPPPWDYRRLLVVAPEGGAGLGDFRREADRLQRHGLCDFDYVFSRFQGEGAAAEITAALRSGLAAAPAGLDAVVLIRGGGAVNDLAWLNDYTLAEALCRLEYPVVTGIGHERDSTVLDEVAQQKFDTPSKVVAGIEQHIVRRSREVQAMFEATATQARRSLQTARADAERHVAAVEKAARAEVGEARQNTLQRWSDIRLAAVTTVHRARAATVRDLQAVRQDATRTIVQARDSSRQHWQRVDGASRSALLQARAGTEAAWTRTLDQARHRAGTAARAVDVQRERVQDLSRKHIATARAGADALVREIAGQGPQKTLSRGFALVRTPEGDTVTRAQDVQARQAVELTFHDGSVTATLTASPKP